MSPGLEQGLPQTGRTALQVGRPSLRGLRGPEEKGTKASTVSVGGEGGFCPSFRGGRQDQLSVGRPAWLSLPRVHVSKAPFGVTGVLEELCLFPGTERHTSQSAR